jgi:Zn finger protein HypA/HybF involved in hydrogenase expression
MDLAQQFVANWIASMEPKPFHPKCWECQEPITGTSYNGRCFSCDARATRDDQAGEERYERDNGGDRE